MTEKLTVGQEVRVRTPNGSLAGTVTYIGRRWATIRYGSRQDDFDMETRRRKGRQTGVGCYYEVPDPEQERFCAALDILEARGVTILGGADVTPEQVEAIAAILRPASPEGENPDA